MPKQPEDLKNKELELGDIEVIDLSKELSFDDLDIYFNMANADDLTSYAGPYGSSTCTDSCSASTFCC